MAGDEVGVRRREVAGTLLAPLLAAGDVLGGGDVVRPLPDVPGDDGVDRDLGFVGLVAARVETPRGVVDVDAAVRVGRPGQHRSQAETRRHGGYEEQSEKFTVHGTSSEQ